MSYDIFVMRFEGGETAPLDMAVAYEVLDPFAVAREADFLSVRTTDGEEADVYFNPPAGITLNRFGGGGIMDLLAVLLRRLDAVLVAPGGPVVVPRAEVGRLLPDALTDGCPVVVAGTGAEIDQAIRAA
ncbi:MULTISPECIES: hypothetical protein [unclassified Streptomyces]|uniref:hypothetical protein n=1 Tax=unclassified Streptomyces TaxID=2593676 RepID=UPI001E35D84A|nr:hypothetical protein [Streptomyces sp. CB02980]MCB8907254.1 hypothetical protein [Streptomyces sp. CB02980]